MIKSNKPIDISYRNLTKSFYLSSSTSPELLQMLIKTAFRLRFKIDGLITTQSQIVNNLEQVVTFDKLPKFLSKSKEKNFTLHAEEQDQQSNREGISYSRSRSDLCKQSGRKFPPDQRQLSQEKYFVQDFQLFMSEVTSKQTTQTLGILFFSSTRYAKQLGRKILKDLVFQYGHIIQFYYSLYPMRSIINQEAVGPIMMFTIFSGKQMVLQRKFEQSLNAKPQMAKFIKLLIDSGDLQRKIKHLNTKKDLIESQVITLSKQVSAINQQEFKPKEQNAFQQISFDNNDSTAPPKWFFDDVLFDDLQQGMLKYLLDTKQKSFQEICQGLDFLSESKKQFNVQVIKLCCKDWINKFMDDLKPEDKKAFQQQMRDQNSKIIKIVKQFKEDGNLSQILQSIETQLRTKTTKPIQKFQLDLFHLDAPSAIQSRCNSPRVSYLQIANGLNNNVQISGFKLRLCQDNSVQQINQKQALLPGKQPAVHKKVMKLADYYHHARLGTGFSDINMQQIEKYEQNLKTNNYFSQQQIKKLIDLYRSGDPFVRKQINQALQPDDVKHLKQLLKNKTSQFEILQELQSPSLSKARRKIQKFSNFRSLITYLFNYKYINKKQSKLFVYLYTWEDINILGAFESYLLTQDLEQLQDTLYLIDQIYFLTKKYGVEISEVEKFSDIIQHQMSLLFTHKNTIPLENRLALQKLVRAGDTTIIKLYRDNKGEKKDEFIKKINQYADSKRIQLVELQQAQKTKQRKQIINKFERKDQLQQILTIRMKENDPIILQLLEQCIQQNEPIILAIFQVKDLTNDMVEFVDSLKIYIENINKIHIRAIIVSKLKQMEGTQKDFQTINKLIKQQSPLMKGMYEVYKETKDVDQLKDTIRRTCLKLNKII